LDARHCLLFRVSFGLKPDGAEAGRDAGLGGTLLFSRHLVDARRLHLRHRPWPLVRRARCRLLRAGRAGSPPPPPPLAPCAAGGGAHCALSLRSKGLRARGAGPNTGTSAGLECRVHQIASSARLRWPGFTGSGAVWIKGAAGPWSRAYHWHVCWAGVLRAPDRQQRAAASARASPGRAQSGYRPSESPWARGPFKLGGHQAGPCSVGPRARATGRARRACPSQPASGSSPRGRWGLNGRKPSSAGARLGRCGPRDRPAVDRRPGARLDRGLGVCSSTGSLQSR
jgi:hypothetical protein